MKCIMVDHAFHCSNHSYGGGNSRRSASIFYEMLDAWSLLGSKTFCLLHNELSHKKKKDFALTKQALNSKWDEASKILAW